MMYKITSLESIPVPLDESNIDTDAILPARFLLLLDKSGFGKYLLNERRRDPNFILNDSAYKASKILVAGSRFGIGSSREHAVWALFDYGFRCVIAPSFGDILFANCTKNGILPIRLPTKDHKKVMTAGLNKMTITVALGTQSISVGNETIYFDIDPYHKSSLLNGLDGTGAILAHDQDDITAFEIRQEKAHPWLYLSTEQLSIFDTLKKTL